MRRRLSDECPPDIQERLSAYGVGESMLEVLYPHCAPVFNRTTLVQALALANIAAHQQPITLRGLFYRAVSAGVYPDTDEKHYRQCGNILLKLRRAGIVAYDWIVDSTRRRLKPSSWSGLDDFAETVARVYRKDLWARQPHYLEIFVEKDAMAAVIEPVTAEFDVFLNVIRGSCSESFVWQVANVWAEIYKPIIAYYLGDHDPAGLSIEADLQKRLAEMTGKPFEWNRLAITETDFRRADLLGFPIKGDRNTKAWRTRHNEYLTRYGDRCVEVDAIPAEEIRDRVRATVLSHIDREEWAMLQAIEVSERESVRELVLTPKPVESK